MNLIRRIFGEPRYHQFADCFAVRREVLYEALVESIRRQLAKNHWVLVAAHFPNVFSELQQKLELAQLDYEIQAEPIGPGTFFDRLNRGDAPLKITMAAMLSDVVQPSFQFNPDHDLSLMMVERHPLIDKDVQLEKFASQVPCRTRLGYFLSLEDPVLKHSVGSAMVHLLQQLGANEHELISSHMISRRLRKQLIKISADAETDQAADSAAEWFELNLPK